MRQDNAEGSSRCPSVLSGTQLEVLVGTLLGDGCLAKHGNYHRLHVKHSAAQLQLVEYKHRVFGEFISMPVHRFDQVLGEKLFPCAQFATRTSPIFSVWHSRFYREGRKTVPENIGDWLSPLALAVWFMDDGAADHSGVTFQTHNFRPEETETLVKSLTGNFGLEVRHRRNKGSAILYVPAASLPGLRAIVGPHVLPHLRYKLVPRTTRTP